VQNIHLLNWLEYYKDQIGVAIQFGLLIASGVLILVGLRQAQVALEQTKAAKAQALSAQEQVRMASEQLRATLIASDAALGPLIRASFAGFRTYMNDGLTREWENALFKIENRGLGPALEIEIYYGDNPSDSAGSFGEALGVGGEKEENFDKQRLAKDGVTIRYFSVHGSEFKTQIAVFEDSIPDCIFLHKVVKEAFKQEFEDRRNNPRQSGRS
jgi:type II secretory pathway pseudopilin PulG